MPTESPADEKKFPTGPVTAPAGVRDQLPNVAKDFAATVVYLDATEFRNFMKKFLCLSAAWTALSFTSTFGQTAPSPGDSTATGAETRAETPARQPAGKNSEPPLTKFDLDFPGGTPQELVAAIQKAMGRPLNVVIPTEDSGWKLPALKMNAVNVAQLFQAMELASHSTETVAMGNGNYSQHQTQYGFRQSEGRPSDDTVWYFYVNSAAPMPKASRFYYLAPYLDGGLTVDDITTAIQTGWRLRGDAPAPALSFHKETKLLIAVGDYAGLDVIDQVLRALDAVKPKPAADKAAAEPKTKS